MTPKDLYDKMDRYALIKELRCTRDILNDLIEYYNDCCRTIRHYRKVLREQNKGIRRLHKRINYYKQNMMTDHDRFLFFKERCKNFEALYDEELRLNVEMYKEMCQLKKENKNLKAENQVLRNEFELSCKTIKNLVKGLNTDED